MLIYISILTIFKCVRVLSTFVLLCTQPLELLSPQIFYLFIRVGGEWAHKQGEQQAEEKHVLSREPGAGLDPRSPGLWPEPRADS